MPTSALPRPVHRALLPLLAAEARADARRAAGERPVAGWFALSLLGGLTLGASARLGPSIREPRSLLPAAAGGVAPGMPALNVGTGAAVLSAPLTREIQTRPPEYVSAFRDAYVRAVKRRRRNTVLAGGVLGAVAGVGLLWWVVSSIEAGS